MYRISSSYVGMLVAMLQAEGLDAVRLCREAGIDMCLLAQRMRSSRALAPID